MHCSSCLSQLAKCIARTASLVKEALNLPAVDINNRRMPWRNLSWPRILKTVVLAGININNRRSLEAEQVSPPRRTTPCSPAPGSFRSRTSCGGVRHTRTSWTGPSNPPVSTVPESFFWTSSYCSHFGMSEQYVSHFSREPICASG